MYIKEPSNTRKQLMKYNTVHATRLQHKHYIKQQNWFKNQANRMENRQKESWNKKELRALINQREEEKLLGLVRNYKNDVMSRLNWENVTPSEFQLSINHKGQTL